MATRPNAVQSATTRRSLGGTWRSELGSELELHNTDGFLSGRYRSAVGTVQSPRPLIGFCTPPTGSGAVVLGFVVCWSDTGSVTTWTGRYDGDADRLQLTWVLEAATTTRTAWRTTQLGRDQFRRAAPPVTPGPPTRANAGQPGAAANSASSAN